MSEADSPNFEEKRRFKRFPATVEVKFRILHLEDAPKGSLAGKLLSGQAKNYSSSGLFVATYDNPKVGEILEVSFGLPNVRDIQVLGRVIWVSDDSHDPGFGVEMYKTSQEEFDEIIRRAKRGQWIVAELDNKGESGVS